MKGEPLTLGGGLNIACSGTYSGYLLFPEANFSHFIIIFELIYLSFMLNMLSIIVGRG